LKDERERNYICEHVGFLDHDALMQAGYLDWRTFGFIAIFDEKVGKQFEIKLLKEF
jgi:hypothetical protein